jgi:1-acyl-sn-glycerol-3-phosphate acyltransferase
VAPDRFEAQRERLRGLRSAGEEQEVTPRPAGPGRSPRITRPGRPAAPGPLEDEAPPPGGPAPPPSEAAPPPPPRVRAQQSESPPASLPRHGADGRGPAISPRALLEFVSALRSAVGGGLDLPSALERATAVLPPPARESGERIAARLRGDYAQDEWGYDEEFVDLVYPFFKFMYERWWRVKAIGVENVPSEGPAMLVANHAGVLPWDATMMSAALFEQHPQPRQPRFMVLDWAFRLPWVSAFMRRVGGVVASPYNAMRLLEHGHLVMVFPEGTKGAGKPFAERYRLQRFGRGGFVELALRTGSPIVPVAVVGSEEIYPKVAESRLLARLIGAPYFPITPTFPALGPLGAVPLPSRWRIEFCEPIDLSEYGPEAAEDRTLVFELSEQVRETIQGKLFENLVRRGSAFL